MNYIPAAGHDPAGLLDELRTADHAAAYAYPANVLDEVLREAHQAVEECAAEIGAIKTAAAGRTPTRNQQTQLDAARAKRTELQAFALRLAEVVRHQSEQARAEAARGPRFVVRGDADEIDRQYHSGVDYGQVVSARGGSADHYDADPFRDPASAQTRRGRFGNPWELRAVQEFGRDRHAVTSEYRARALDAVEQMPGANDKIRAAATAMVEQHDDGNGNLSRLVLALSSPAYYRAWSKLARDAAHELSPEETAAMEHSRQVARAMSLTDNAGGVLVPFQLDPAVIIRSNGTLNEIRQIARQVVATGDVWHGVGSEAISWSWDAEGSEVSDDTPPFDSPAIPVHAARGFVPISIEALEDEANVAQELARLFAAGKEDLEAEAFATGTGSGQPTGIVTALAGGSSVVSTIQDGAFAAGDIYALDSALPARFRKRASWLAHRTVYNSVRRFDANGGAQMWERIGADQPAKLMGRDALECEAMDSTWAAGGTDNLMVYGDFSHFVIADRVGFRIELVPHLFGSNRRPTGQRGWFAWYRTGSDSVNDGAFRMLVA
ncbi:hypothetical protein GCM10010472_04130 [Pseudonocardia halophobica]|uniref:Phage capsid-like C-terminal domain-containing protein n=1 Tax=Pseudonocardia halophobica TaxID=29401 RepID=A0A9W6L5D2_9PSEU|nr:phage major capsid protein [Pseudonocardia halophobica]GLL13372.1 hypothetical protein GCM10017577_45150 [Pseudonocardia halophobica]